MSNNGRALVVTLYVKLSAIFSKDGSVVVVELFDHTLVHALDEKLVKTIFAKVIICKANAVVAQDFAGCFLPFCRSHDAVNKNRASRLVLRELGFGIWSSGWHFRAQ